MKYEKSYLPILVLVAGSFLIAAWMFLITPELKRDLDEFSYQSSYFGKSAQVESIGSELPQPVPVFTTYRQDVSKINGNTLEILSSFVTYDVLTNKMLWQANRTNLVDKNTVLFVDPPDVYFHFPHNTKKQNYRAYLYANGEPQPFVFEKEVYLNDLKVYRFSCKFTTDISHSYPQFSPKQILTDYTCDVLIEPITGNEIYYEENWFDYIVENGKKIPVSTGDVHTTEFSKDLLVRKAIDKIKFFYLYENVIPVFLSIIVVASCLAFIIYDRQRQTIIQERLQREKHEKLSIIGNLASRVAHDIRNPLTIINNAVTLMKHNSDLSEVDVKRIDQIENAIFRISYQIDSVLDHLFQRSLKIGAHNISKLIDSAISEIRNPHNIPIVQQNLDLTINCDYQLMKIVFINLIVNAIQAIGSDGKITIRAFDLPGKKIIEVENTGPEITKENMSKIFEPLFTTKQQGTGLGLSSCLNIINQHRGTITVKNNPTTFIISLPTNLK